MNKPEDEKDIEIIPPGETQRRERDVEWFHISIDGAPNPFSNLPLHKKLLLAAASAAGLLAVGVVVLLIIASAVLIWIPLLLAISVVMTLFLLFRGKKKGHK